MHLAELNFGTLRYPWDDPRLADFQNNLDRVNALARRSAGFVWMLDEDAMDFEQSDPSGAFFNRPNTASTLSVWTDATSLYTFAVDTIHGRFLARGHEWFRVDDRSHLVVWQIAPGHRPTVAEGFQHWQALQVHGETDTVFAAKGLKERALASC